MFHISGPIVLTPNTYALAECQKIQAKYALTFEVFYIIWVLKLFHCYIRFHFISVFFLNYPQVGEAWTQILFLKQGPVVLLMHGMISHQLSWSFIDKTVVIYVFFMFWVFVLDSILKEFISWGEYGWCMIYLLLIFYLVR